MDAQLQTWVDHYEAEERKQETQTMGRYTKDTGGGDFKQAPAGNHLARCIKIIDLGTHHDEYEGKPTVRNQVVIQWELPHELDEFDGQQKPLIVSKFYTNSLSEKANLRKDLEGWRGRPFTTEELMRFDLEAVLGKPCMVNVVHNEKGKAKVTSVAALPKGMTCPPAANAPTSFWIEPFDDNAFAALSEGFRKIIAESDEWKDLNSTDGAARSAAPAGIDDDDIPF